MSPRTALTVALLGAALTVAMPTGAQTPPPANPLDTMPDKIGFDIPYGAPSRSNAPRPPLPPRSLKRRKKTGRFCVSRRRLRWQPRRLRAHGRDAALVSPRLGTQSPHGGLYRRETKVFENAIQLNNFYYLTTLDGVIAARGGIPLVEGGKLIGAIGCCGGTGSQDEVVCKVGAALFK